MAGGSEDTADGSVSALIRRSLDTLSAGERKVGRAIIANYPSAGLGTVAELAQRAEVSAPTVVRFVARLGFSGYPAFQKRLVREVQERLGSPLEQYGRDDLHTEDSELARASRTFSASISATIAELSESTVHRATELLAQPRRRVRLIGGRFSGLLASYLAAHLTMLRAEVQTIGADEFAQLTAITDTNRGDVLVVFDYRRYDPEVVHLARQVAERGAEVVLFTDRWLSPAADVAGIVLPAGVESPSPFDSMVPALAVVETVIAGVADRLGEAGTSAAGRDGDAARARRAALTRAGGPGPGRARGGVGSDEGVLGRREGSGEQGARDGVDGVVLRKESRAVQRGLGIVPGGLDADEHHQRGHRLTVVREVIRPERSHRLGRADAQARQPLLGSDGEAVVVDEGGLAVDQPHLRDRAVGLRSVLGQCPHRVEQHDPVRRIRGAHGRADARARGQHIRRALSGRQRTDADQRGTQRIDRAPHDLRHPDGDLRDRRDRIAGVLRVCAVPPVSVDENLDLVGRGIDETAGRRDGTAWHARMHMRCDDMADAELLEHPGLHQLSRAGGVALLARLQQGDQPERQVQPGGRAQQRHHRRLMHIVSAGVHRTPGGREGSLGLLRHRQRIKLGTHGDRLVVRPDPPRGPGIRERCERHPLAHRSDQTIPRGMLLPREVRCGVQLASQFPRRGQLRVQRRLPARGELGQPRIHRTSCAGRMHLSATAGSSSR